MPRICFTLAFGTATEQAVQALWSHIANASITKPDPARYRPHITLAVYDVESIKEYETILAPVASALAPFPAAWNHWGYFLNVG